MRPARLAALALAALLVAGCDFTPALDIDVPEHEARAVIRAVLAADSVAVVRVGVSRDPYGVRSGYYGPEATPAARVTLLREGGAAEVLALRSEPCVDFSGLEEQTYECGPYVGAVPVEAGATYTVRVEVDGLPPAEGTVRVPPRPAVTVVEAAGGAGRRFRVRLEDPAGAGDRYGFGFVRANGSVYQIETCDEGGVCRDSVVVDLGPDRYPVPFQTSDPVLLSATRQVPGEGVDFATFTDRTFDGGPFTFAVDVDDYEYVFGYAPLTVQVAALSASVYDAYQVGAFSLGDDNPFAEPANLPTNVEGGYGVVGAVALAEVVFPGLGGAGATGR